MVNLNLLEEHEDILRCVCCETTGCLELVSKPLPKFVSDEWAECHFHCEYCDEDYPVTWDGIPVFWSPELKRIYRDEAGDSVARANKVVYDAISEGYDQFSPEQQKSSDILKAILRESHLGTEALPTLEWVG